MNKNNIGRSLFKIIGSHKLKKGSFRLLLGTLALSSTLVTGCGKTNNHFEVVEEKVESHLEHDHYVPEDKTAPNLDNTNVNELIQSLDSEQNIPPVPSLMEELALPDLSGYQGYSIVEGLNSIGAPSSFAARSELAKLCGINNYRGTATQNLTLLAYLKGEKTVDHVLSQNELIRKIYQYETNINDCPIDDILTWAIEKGFIDSGEDKELTKADYVNILFKYAESKNVNLNNYIDDEDKNYILSSFKDKKLTCENPYQLVWAYYMGYIDIDTKDCVNEKELIKTHQGIKEFERLLIDIIEAIKNNHFDANGKLLLTPSNIKFDRDAYDSTLINDIRNKGLGNIENILAALQNSISAPQQEEAKPNHNHGSDPGSESNDQVHEHSWSEWKALNDYFEIRKCLCNKVEMRSHLYGKEMTNFKDLNDGTHEKILTRYCSTCTHTKKKVISEACNYGPWVDNLDGTESRVCTDCGHTVTKDKEHIHSWSAWTSISDTEEQRTCSCGEIEKREHSYGLPQISYKTKNDGTHDKISKKQCSTCSHDVETKLNQNCSFGDWIDNLDGTESRVCEDCGHTEMKDKEHIHSWSAWTSISDTEEQRTCSCGEIEKREHSYGLPQISYKTKNDGTHDKISKKQCSTCSHDVETKLNQNCSFGDWIYNKLTGNEERTCEHCDYKETRKHTHSEVPNNLEYKNPVINNDGTHTLSASYVCTLCNEKIIVNKTEDCSYGAWEYRNHETDQKTCSVCSHKVIENHIPDVSGKRIVQTSDKNSHNEVFTCDHCKQEIATSITCTPGATLLYRTEGNVVYEYHLCTECNGVCNEKVHTHAYGSWTHKDDNNCVRSCICGVEETKTHTFGELSKDPTSGKLVKTCQDCGFTVSMEHVHDFEETKEYPSNKSDDYCYILITKCKDGSCSEETREDVGHDYDVEDFGLVLQYTCLECGYKKNEMKNAVLSVESAVILEEDGQEEIIDEEKDIENTEKNEEITEENYEKALEEVIKEIIEESEVVEEEVIEEEKPLEEPSNEVTEEPVEEETKSEAPTEESDTAKILSYSLE